MLDHRRIIVYHAGPMTCICCVIIAAAGCIHGHTVSRAGHITMVIVQAKSRIHTWQPVILGLLSASTCRPDSVILT